MNTCRWVVCGQFCLLDKSQFLSFMGSDPKRVQHIQCLVRASVTPGQWSTCYVSSSLKLPGPLSALKFKNVKIRGLTLNNPLLFSAELYLGQADCQGKGPSCCQCETPVRPFNEGLRNYKASRFCCSAKNGTNWSSFRGNEKWQVKSFTCFIFKYWHKKKSKDYTNLFQNPLWEHFFPKNQR